jgi:hypothetical protein
LKQFEKYTLQMMVLCYFVRRCIFPQIAWNVSEQKGQRNKAEQSFFRTKVTKKQSKTKFF